MRRLYKCCVLPAGSRCREVHHTFLRRRAVGTADHAAADRARVERRGSTFGRCGCVCNAMRWRVRAATSLVEKGLVATRRRRSPLGFPSISTYDATSGEEVHRYVLAVTSVGSTMPPSSLRQQYRLDRLHARTGRPGAPNKNPPQIRKLDVTGLLAHISGCAMTRTVECPP